MEIDNWVHELNFALDESKRAVTAATEPTAVQLECNSNNNNNNNSSSSTVASMKFGMHRRASSAGNLLLYCNNTEYCSEDSSSAPSSLTKTNQSKDMTSSSITTTATTLSKLHHSDSDDINNNNNSNNLSKTLRNKANNIRMKHALHNLFRYRKPRRVGVNMDVDFDSDSEFSPNLRLNLRRKRRFKRTSDDMQLNNNNQILATSTPFSMPSSNTSHTQTTFQRPPLLFRPHITPQTQSFSSSSSMTVVTPSSGKRKRTQKFDNFDRRHHHHHHHHNHNYNQIFNQSKFGQNYTPTNSCCSSSIYENNNNNNSTSAMQMEDDTIEDGVSGDFASESSISWSGGEGNDGDDELTDWAPRPQPTSPAISNDNIDSTQTSTPLLTNAIIHKHNDAGEGGGGGELREIRAGYRRLGNCSNERVVQFLKDSSSNNNINSNNDQERLGQLAALYSLDLHFTNENRGISTLASQATSSSSSFSTAAVSVKSPKSHHNNGGMKPLHKRVRTHNIILN